MRRACNAAISLCCRALKSAAPGAQSMDWMRANREAFSAKRKAAAASAVERHFAAEQVRRNREAAK
jgi:hypothetical protein